MGRTSSLKMCKLEICRQMLYFESYSRDSSIFLVDFEYVYFESYMNIIIMTVPNEKIKVLKLETKILITKANIYMQLYIRFLCMTASVQ